MGYTWHWVIICLSYPIGISSSVPYSDDGITPSWVQSIEDGIILQSINSRAMVAFNFISDYKRNLQKQKEKNFLNIFSLSFSIKYTQTFPNISREKTDFSYFFLLRWNISLLNFHKRFHLISIWRWRHY